MAIRGHIQSTESLASCGLAIFISYITIIIIH